MPLTSRSLVSLCAAAGLALALSAQDSPKKKDLGAHLSARELFYAAVQAPASAPKTDASKVTPKTVPRRQKTTPQPVEVAGADNRPPAVPRADHTNLPDGGQVTNASSNAARTSSANGLGAAPGAAPEPALGLRYTILRVAGSSTVEAAPDTVFHAGDRIQLKVEANNPGYLYIINQGSSGTWKPIFPSSEVENGNNRVESLHAYTLPSEQHRMVFDETAGAEKLFIILSRQPEPDLEKMIYSLQGKPAGDAGQHRVDGVRSDESSKQLIMASNQNIDNDTVGRMRNAYARDLIIEKVTPASPGDKKETAVYVVNPTGSSSSRVVADLSLVHQ
ncbi:MAG TPA: DUF4384 domain-containing protein [Candidatus Acidoferrales bacterium]|nr:DUF4384 domain-containing protein [Candidatus Acidoferrales bacterium]